MKKLLSVILAVVFVFAFASCTENGTGKETTGAAEPAKTEAQISETEAVTEAPAEKTVVNVAMLKGPTGMGAAYLMSKNEENKTENKYNFALESAADAVVAGIVKGEYDIAAVPTNLAATLYAKDGVDVVAAAINTLGVLYIVENGNTVNSVSDLSGKKIVMSGQGTAADAVLTRLIAAKVDDPSSVTVDYVSEHSEAVTQAVTGNYDIAVLPEPFVTTILTKSDKFRVAVNLTTEWESAGYGTLCMGGIIASKKFAQEHPEALDSFLAEYKESVEYVNANVKDAAALIEKYGIATAAVAEKAIPNCNIVCITGENMKTYLKAFYEQLSAFKPALIGGSVPGDDLYYIK